MSCNHTSIAKLTVRFEHVDAQEFELAGGQTHFEMDLSHIPREGDMVQPPMVVYPYECEVTEVFWDFNTPPPHVIVRLSS